MLRRCCSNYLCWTKWYVCCAALWVLAWPNNIGASWNPHRDVTWSVREVWNSVFVLLVLLVMHTLYILFWVLRMPHASPGGATWRDPTNTTRVCARLPLRRFWTGTRRPRLTRRHPRDPTSSTPPSCRPWLSSRRSGTLWGPGSSLAGRLPGDARLAMLRPTSSRNASQRHRWAFEQRPFAQDRSELIGYESFISFRYLRNHVNYAMES